MKRMWVWKFCFSGVESGKNVASAEKGEQLPAAVIIEVPRIDDESVQDFFGSDSNKAADGGVEKIDVSIDAFDDLFIYSNDMLVIVNFSFYTWTLKRVFGQQRCLSYFVSSQICPYQY